MHPMPVPFIEENDQTRAREEHLEALRALVGNVYPNKFERSEVVEPGKEDTITAVLEKYRGFQPDSPEGGNPAAEAIELANQQLNTITVRLAGRIASPPRVMGKAAFVHLSDGSSRLQIYVKRADVAACATMQWAAKSTAGNYSLCSITAISSELKVICSSLKPVSFPCTSRNCSFWPRHCCRCLTRCTAFT